MNRRWHRLAAEAGGGPARPSLPGGHGSKGFGSAANQDQVSAAGTWSAAASMLGPVFRGELAVAVKGGVPGVDRGEAGTHQGPVAGGDWAERHR